MSIVGDHAGIFFGHGGKLLVRLFFKDRQFNSLELPKQGSFFEIGWLFADFLTWILIVQFPGPFLL